jgi:hypothetical protein
MERSLRPLVATFLLALVTCSGSATAVLGPFAGVYVLCAFGFLLALFAFSSAVTWVLLRRYP